MDTLSSCSFLIKRSGGRRGSEAGDERSKKRYFFERRHDTVDMGIALERSMNTTNKRGCYIRKKSYVLMTG
jgi:hypothetical protein